MSNDSYFIYYFLAMQKIYYVGIGRFGYAVFYDENGENILVSRVFSTFSQARDYLLKLQK